ncbi:IclR family transcriptional regulator [Rhizorhapis suberifaciens]|uniref:IclR family acetate operon transcriptional repressor n=1 Tax=Rhizorhapis suberifaciens TaxID=13656 RepID=A0A840HT13_9SPHN|nr:IclR family transcriptional regulator C-terminal domain-containing protein [Rhizorhapis suberifaciens]MBB4640749.1 IclR family acetate operon transcriptional repressor [Rhizorhapis suberifaciens]
MAGVEPGGSVKSAMRTLDVLELLVGQARPMAAHEIAAALAIPMSSLSYLLSTLAERGYLERSGRFYGIGDAIRRLQPRRAAPTVAERAVPLVASLRHQLNETASFFVRRGFEIEAVASEVGQHALRYTLEVGQRAPLHSFAAGKALLARLDEDELSRYFNSIERMAFTPKTLVSEQALRADIEEARRAGIARTCEEHTPGIIGIGCAALVDGVAVGAFSVAIPVARFDPGVEERCIRLLTRAAEALATH